MARDPEAAEMSYVDMRGMPSRDQVVAHYAEVSGRQVDDLDYYLVLAKWKLAIVLEQGFQRAGDDEKLLAFGPVVTDLMASAAELAESTDYAGLSGRCVPRSARPTGRRRSSGSRNAPSPRSSPARSGCGCEAAAVNFPDVLLIANEYQISVPPPFVPGSEFAGVVDEVSADTTGFAIGDRVTGTGLFGAFAERVAVPIAALTRIPDGVDTRTAAAFGVAHRTAYHTLRSMARHLLRRRTPRTRRRRRRRAGGGATGRRTRRAGHRGGVVS